MNYEEDDDLYDVPARFSQRMRRQDRKHSRRPKKASAPKLARDAPTTAGVVVGLGPGSATVVTTDDREVHAFLGASLRQRQRTDLAVGDDVVVAEEGEVAVVVRVAPRRTSLGRLDPHNQFLERVVVANVDVVVVVSAAVDPPPRTGLIDRYLVAIQSGGAQPLLVVNKVDQADEAALAELHRRMAPYDEGPVPLLWCSAVTGEGLTELAEALAGRRCALVGHSGVGKSSLLTALGSQAEVGGLAGHGRGRHTTSSSTLHRTAAGAEIIDTPGVRQFAPMPVSAAELQRAFPAIDALAEGCRFAGCSHVAEPECAVVAAVDAGTLGPDRLESFQRLRSQLVR